MDGDKIYLETQNKELWEMMHNHDWDIGLTVSLYGYHMMKRAVQFSNASGVAEQTRFPDEARNNIARRLEIQEFYNPAIADNLAQVEAVCAIVSKRSGLAPVCFYISTCPPHVSGESPSNISHNPSDVITEVSEP